MDRQFIFSAMFSASLFFLPISSTFAVDRPKLITEEFYANRSELNHYRSPNYYSNRSTADSEKIWRKLLLNMDLETSASNISPYGGRSECRYDAPLEILQQIRLELGASNSYQKIWIKNQEKVFTACRRRSGQASPPEEPIADVSLPVRAESDYLYQLATWHFYRKDYDQAMQLYQRVENNHKAPLRANAAYMSLRCLNGLDRPEEAYAKAEAMLSDASLITVHGLVGNYRFILMNATHWPTVSITPELAKKHLSWLLSITHASPTNAADLKQALADYVDAMEQIDGYFPLYDPDTKSVDWWLTGSQSPTPRMQAVQTLAPESELADWLQAYWAHNVFATDWLWALHRQENGYWAQNRTIVEHAWKRWKNGDGGEWLQIAIDRVHPQDPLAGEIIQAASPYLDTNWKGETLEYRQWLFDIWENLLRVHLGRDEYEQVVGLVDMANNFKGIFDNSDISLSQKTPHGYSCEKVLRWLVYTGKIDNARNALFHMLSQYPNSFRHWRTLLATDWLQVIASVQGVGLGRWPTYGDVFGNSFGLWQKMANLLPANELFKLSEDTQINEPIRGLLARSALTRAFIMGTDSKFVDQYAIQVAKLNPSIREQLLLSIESHDKQNYIDFLLRMPRFRPQPFTDVALSQPSTGPEEQNFSAIDQFNRKDNNWWCHFDRQALEAQIFREAKIVPYADRIFGINSDNQESEFSRYINFQKTLIDQHPYKQLIDQHEIATLEAIPDAPQYLTEAVLEREIEIPVAWNIWYPNTIRNRHASNLHHAVRTTRYGCTGHGPSSKRAFRVLHQQYGGTIWAKATPYWFNMDFFYHPNKNTH